MHIPKNATVAVVDGEKLVLFHNVGEAEQPKLSAVLVDPVDRDNKGSGHRHHSSSANPDDHRLDEDGFAAGVTAMLNQQATAGKIKHLVVIAPAKTLGEMRKHYDKGLSSALVGEIAKDLTGHSAHDIEKALVAA